MFTTGDSQRGNNASVPVMEYRRMSLKRGCTRNTRARIYMVEKRGKPWQRRKVILPCLRRGEIRPVGIKTRCIYCRYPVRRKGRKVPPVPRVVFACELTAHLENEPPLRWLFSQDAGRKIKMKFKVTYTLAVAQHNRRLVPANSPTMRVIANIRGTTARRVAIRNSRANKRDIAGSFSNCTAFLGRSRKVRNSGLLRLSARSKPKLQVFKFQTKSKVQNKIRAPFSQIFNLQKEKNI